MIGNLITACRFCGNRNIEPCIDIGDQYLSSIFPEDLSYKDKLKKFPLGIVRCVKENENQCGSLQLANDYNLDLMYADYPYKSSSNSYMLSILEDVARSGIEKVTLKKGDVVLDIGCNDGTLLSYFTRDDLYLIGIDPAKNIESTFAPKNFVRAKEFFTRSVYQGLTGSKAKLVFSVAMFYHLSDPVGFCTDVASILSDDGIFVIQMAYLPAMITNNMYDNIVHEHVGYYSTLNMKWILEKAGLDLVDVSFNNVYGGSFRVFAKKRVKTASVISERVHHSLEQESSVGVLSSNFYISFVDRIQASRSRLVNLMSEINAKGHSIWGYGASTKGNTILQFCGLSGFDLVAVADTNPYKLGRFMVGSDVPILSESEMRYALPEYLLVLPYSFTADFRRREHKIVSKGVKFICPLPDVKVI
jgi:NDP-4-keto-2,6-dideoxyhexose 3-C-methyltransferase